MELFKFISDERGASEEVFKLAMIVVIVAAVLAVLAFIIDGVWKSAEEVKSQDDLAADVIRNSSGSMLNHS